MQDDPVYEEFLREVTHGLPWHTAQKLLESIEEDRKAKAAAVAKRLLGKHDRCPDCGGYNNQCPTCWGALND